MARFAHRLGFLALAAAMAAALAVPTGGGAMAQPPYPEFCDVNGDNETTISDALLIAQDVVDLIDIADQPGECDGDFDQDDELTISDALLVAQRVVGLV